jgi:hypothetical protein
VPVPELTVNNLTDESGDNLGFDILGLIDGTQEFREAHRDGDRPGMILSGATVVTSSADLALKGAKLIECEAPAVDGVVNKANVVLAVGTSLYQVIKADGHFVDEDGSLGNKSVQALESGTVAGVSVGLGTAATTAAETTAFTAVLGTGGGTVVAVAAPVVLTAAAVGATAYTAKLAHENWRQYREQDKETAENFRVTKLDRNAQLGLAPNVYKYKNLPAVMGDVSKYIRDDEINGKVERSAGGFIRNTRQLDWNDSKNLNAYEAALTLAIEDKKTIINDNDSILPRWIRWGESAEKYNDAKIALTQLESARQELAMYRDDVKKYNEGMGLGSKAPPPARAASSRHAPASLTKEHAQDGPANKKPTRPLQETVLDVVRDGSIGERGTATKHFGDAATMQHPQAQTADTPVTRSGFLPPPSAVG